MEKWLEKRSAQTMNLRSVFTAEQQRILERYYTNGMTNQSKSCFQLILQCAQETKLDFSVVRTWVGNKRRKLASKADQNGDTGQNVCKHAVHGAAGVLVAGSVVTAEMATAQGFQRGPSVNHLLPPQASCSSSSSSPSSSSPLSSGSGPHSNSDVILTGIYSVTRNSNRFDPSAHNTTLMKTLPLHTEISSHNLTPLHTDGAMHYSTITALRRKASHIPNSSTPKCGQILKPFTPKDSAGIPPSWAKQYRVSQHRTWSLTSPQKNIAVHQNSPNSTIDNSIQIQQVVTLAESEEASQRPLPGNSQDRETRKTWPVCTSEIFSIAMETGDADHEYSREEEFANLGAQLQFSKASGSESSADGGRNSGAGVSSLIDNPDTCSVTERSQSNTVVNYSNSARFGEKERQTNSSLLRGTSSHDSFPLQLLSQTSSRMPIFKVTSNMSASWVNNNSRKRTLQDRTQFSDRDLYTLKRYWDNGMTSLGSVCKEKISAAANELGVDTEIIKTWIGNRRRKYRLMGIDIPPPKGGPAMFFSVLNQTSSEPCSPQIPLEDKCEPGEGSEDNEIVSLCFSDDEGSDLYHKETDDGKDGSDSSTPAVKTEIIGEEDVEGDMMTSEMEQIQNLLEFKNEEVQYLENELENQRQRFTKLKSFTTSLLIAVKNSDREKQQELLASLPQKFSEDWDLSLDINADSSVEMTSNQSDSSVSEGEVDTEPTRL